MRTALLLAPLLFLAVGCDWLPGNASADSDPTGTGVVFPVPSAWQVETIEGVAAPVAGSRVMGTVLFERGEVNGVGACNAYGGSYSARSGVGTDNRIAISGLWATEMYCGDTLHPFEDQLFDVLVGAERWSLGEDGRLILRGAQGEVVLLPLLTSE